MKKIYFLVFLLLSSISISYSAESKKLIVLLDWFANPNHAPLFVAEQQGYFKAQGLEVELIGPADPSDPPKLVSAGKADIAITYEPQLIEQIDQGLPLIRIGTLVDQPLDCLVVLKNGPIDSIKKLKNKRIGYSTGGLSNISLKVMLEHHAIQLTDVEAINVHYDLTQALLSKKVDAVTGMMRNFELIQMELAGHPGLAFFPEQNGVPTYSELIFVVNKNKIQDPRFKKFLTALTQGVNYLQQHPEETWNQFAKTHPELNDELSHRAWLLSSAYFAKDPAKFNQKSWQVFINFMKKNNLIQHQNSINTYVIDITKNININIKKDS